MCTVSWVRQAGGYTLAFNRDERRTRPPGGRPQIRSSGGLESIAPSDPEGGGTWIGVNCLGLTVCLANRYVDVTTPLPVHRVSRGQLVASLLGCGSRDDLRVRIESSDLHCYEPFTLVGVEPGLPALLLVWNGHRLSASEHEADGLVLTTSAVDQSTADFQRRAAFTEAIAREGLNPDTLTHLHARHLPTEGPWSVCMHRGDAETVSFSRIDVAADQVQFRYTPGPPCRTPPDASVVIARELRHRPLPTLATSRVP
jgi:hypothetical protein